MMKEPKTLAILSVLCALLAQINAFAKAPEDCEQIAIYEHIARNHSPVMKHHKNCVGLVKKAEEAWEETKKINKKTIRAESEETGGQASELSNAAHLSEAASKNLKNQAEAARVATERYSEISKEAKKYSDDLDREYNLLVSSGKVKADDETFKAAYLKAKNDFIKIHRDTGEASYGTRIVHNQSGISAAQMQKEAEERRLLSEKLAAENGNKKDGVSTNTMVALGGTAIIAAGTVGGLAYFGNKAIEKSDKAAAARIEQARLAAIAVAADAEARAKRLIDYLKDSAEKVLASTEATATKILNKAKDTSVDLISALTGELSAAFPNLSSEKLKKLGTEMEAVFDSLISKANASNDTALATKLKNAKKSVSDQIAAELKKRGAT